MSAKPVAAADQYRLIMECRSSGLTDHQWCMEHGIKPGTFYNWVKRLRKKGCGDIPAPARMSVPVRQEIVKVEITPPAPETNAPKGMPPKATWQTPVMEIAINNAVVRIPNGMDPHLMERAVRILGEMLC